MNADDAISLGRGSHATLLTTAGAIGSSLSSVAISPDGTQISFDDNQRHIYKINTDGSGLVLLNDAGIYPDWSPRRCT